MTQSGVSDARLWYAARLYALYVVGGLGYKFNDDPGWPDEIPFRDLNRIPGGKPVYIRLLSDWDAGRLRFVKATEEDKRNALLNPWLVFPNAAQRTAALAIPRTPSTNLVHRITDFASRFQLPAPPSPPTTGVVLHPSTMLPQFTFSVLPKGAQDAADASAASSALRAERSQRSDINKSRKRPITNPEGRKLRHPKRGPMTTKNIVEAGRITADDSIHGAIEGGGIVLTDEDLRDCVEVAGQASSSRNHGGTPQAELSPPEDSPDEIESTDELGPLDLRVGRPRRLRM